MSHISFIFLSAKNTPPVTWSVEAILIPTYSSFKTPINIYKKFRPRAASRMTPIWPELLTQLTSCRFTRRRVRFSISTTASPGYQPASVYLGPVANFAFANNDAKRKSSTSSHQHTSTKRWHWASRKAALLKRPLN